MNGYGKRRFLPERQLENLAHSRRDNDNEDLDCRCSTSATRALLAEAPSHLREHAALALADFDRAGILPLSELRSDTVAATFRINTGPRTSNLLVARMTVPGGPWPGHFGLEAIVFKSFKVRCPDWFPAIDVNYSLSFADVQMASNGFMRGQGAVLFPELLSIRKRLERQSFGVVFLDRLTALYVSRVLPVLAQFGVEVSPEDSVRELRQLAFLAHEWGHLNGPVPYEKTVRARRRRLIAIISELYADLAGLTMLLDADTPTALRAAEMLVLDRIAREAWLPRARSQVNSVAARQLLMVLRSSQYAAGTGQHRPFDIRPANERLRQELSAVSHVEAACSDGDVEPARRYFTSYGWRLDDSGYQLDLDDDLSRSLRSAAKAVSNGLTTATTTTLPTPPLSCFEGGPPS